MLHLMEIAGNAIQITTKKLLIHVLDYQQMHMLQDQVGNVNHNIINLKLYLCLNA